MYKKHSFLHHTVTGDEKWVYYDYPKRKPAYVDPGQPGPPQPKRDIHCQKAMLHFVGSESCNVLWAGKSRWNGCSWSLSTPYGQFSTCIERKTASNSEKIYNVLFHDDNARPHRARTAQNKIESTGWDRLDQPAYSPDLAPSDYHLFRSMQMDLADVLVEITEEVRNWVDGCRDPQTKMARGHS